MESSSSVLAGPAVEMAADTEEWVERNCEWGAVWSFCQDPTRGRGSSEHHGQPEAAQITSGSLNIDQQVPKVTFSCDQNQKERTPPEGNSVREFDAPSVHITESRQSSEEKVVCSDDMNRDSGPYSTAVPLSTRGLVVLSSSLHWDVKDESVHKVLCSSADEWLCFTDASLSPENMLKPVEEMYK